MNIEKCRLFQLNRKIDLKKILGINSFDLVQVMRKQYKVRIQDGKRLIEEPCEELKEIQSKILRLLYDIDVDENVFSGICGSSAYDNAMYHIQANEIIELDIQKFFPNTVREKVYAFFRCVLNMSPDLATICTDITTIDYSMVDISEDVEEFLRKKHIKTRNHLPSGAPTSQLLSYLANLNMFEQLSKYAYEHNMRVSVYVDDITFSIEKGHFKNKVLGDIGKIIRKNGYSVAKNKTKKYTAYQFKKVTGFVISPEKKLVIPNKIRMKIRKILDMTDSKKNSESLKGLISFAQISEKNKYKNIEKK